MKLIDPIVGELTFDHGWCRQLDVEFLGQTQLVTVCLNGDPDAALDTQQQSAFEQFSTNKERMMRDASSELLRYFLARRSEIVARTSHEGARSLVSEMTAEAQLRELVELKEIYFPESSGSLKQTFGLLLDCDWDPSLGIGIRFEDQVVVEIGPQDVVLS